MAPKSLPVLRFRDYLRDRRQAPYAKLTAMTICVRLTVLLAVVLLLPTPAASQSFDTVGTRAAGMSGAFVAVSDDASAVYWNPAGFAAGSYFSLVLDWGVGETDTAVDEPAGSRSGWMLALGMPALGLSYYRLRSTALEPLVSIDGSSGSRNFTDEVQVRSLVSHHVGSTLVQSILPGLAVGATLKLVRGVAASEIGTPTDRESVLDGEGLSSKGTNRFDVDLGVMATSRWVKAGLTVRNVSEPDFATPGGDELTLERQARAGVALLPLPGWTLAADVDLLENHGVTGIEGRDMAIGAEGRVWRRAFVRAGTRFALDADGPGGRRSSTSFGGSFAVMASVLVDAQVTTGSKWAPRGWGLAARFVY